MKIKEIGFSCWLFERKRRFYNNLWKLKYNFIISKTNAKNNIKLKVLKGRLKNEYKQS